MWGCFFLFVLFCLVSFLDKVLLRHIFKLHMHSPTWKKLQRSISEIPFWTGFPHKWVPREFLFSLFVNWSLKWRPSIVEFYVEPNKQTKSSHTSLYLVLHSLYKVLREICHFLNRTTKQLFRALNKTRLTPSTPTNTLGTKGSPKILWIVNKSCFLNWVILGAFSKRKAFYFIHSRVALRRTKKTTLYGAGLDIQNIPWAFFISLINFSNLFLLQASTSRIGSRLYFILIFAVWLLGRGKRVEKF